VLKQKYQPSHIKVNKVSTVLNNSFIAAAAATTTADDNNYGSSNSNRGSIPEKQSCHVGISNLMTYSNGDINHKL
jgi:hypothetical protein